MRFLGTQVVFAGATIIGLLACSASNSASDGFAEGPVPNEGPSSSGGGTGFGGSAATCTEDAGVLTPIGPQGCGANQTVVYRKPIAGTGASGIASGAGTAQTPPPPEVTACTDTKCGPGQVAVVTYQASAPSLSTDAGGSDAAAASFGDGAAPVVDGGAKGAAPLPDGQAPEASALATADASDDASDDATGSAGDAGVIGIPCGAVVTCIDAPPTCPQGQSPSYAPSGRWHCMPLCDSSSSNVVVINYGATYGNTSICASAPPKTGCAQGQVWTWDYENEVWVCAPECNNGQYDQHVYGGQTVCVPC
jgi:hypothetical protein